MRQHGNNLTKRVLQPYEGSNLKRPERLSQRSSERSSQRGSERGSERLSKTVGRPEAHRLLG